MDAEGSGGNRTSLSNSGGSTQVRVTRRSDDLIRLVPRRAGPSGLRYYMRGIAGEYQSTDEGTWEGFRPTRWTLGSLIGMCPFIAASQRTRGCILSCHYKADLFRITKMRTMPASCPPSATGIWQNFPASIWNFNPIEVPSLHAARIFRGARILSSVESDDLAHRPSLT